MPPIGQSSWADTPPSVMRLPPISREIRTLQHQKRPVTLNMVYHLYGNVHVDAYIFSYLKTDVSQQSPNTLLTQAK